VRPALRQPPSLSRGAATASSYFPLDDDEDMNDRLAELRGGAPMGGGGDIESAVPVGSSAFMAPFFDDVQDIKKAMSTIRYNIGQIEKDHGENLTAISAEQGRACNQRLDDLMKTTNGVATQVRNKLKSMDAENKDFAQRNVGSSEARIRSNMHGTLTRKFVDLMAEYQELQTKCAQPAGATLRALARRARRGASAGELRSARPACAAAATPTRPVRAARVQVQEQVS
jgi:hypothetical protein